MGQALTTARSPQTNVNLRAMMIGTVGVVLGDIDTSLLYSLKECFSPDHGIPSSSVAVFGIISILFWVMVIVVSLKYVLFVTCADNNDEGGILALMVLSLHAANADSRRMSLLIMLGVFGACILYGDAVITPAISALSAMKGPEIAAPALSPFVLLATIMILAVLFLTQCSGASVIGGLFGPAMLLWFAMLAVLNTMDLVKVSQISVAVNPIYTIPSLYNHVPQAFIVPGSVFLVLTDAEALYVGMSHFDARSIRWAWFFVIVPGLLVNYFDRGAMPLTDPGTIKSPSYRSVPEALQLPMVVLTAAVTVIASQAVISGTFSLTSQTIRLGPVPRICIRYTPEAEVDQIYMPMVNWMLLIPVVGVMLTFKKSDDLATAYGVAMTTTMVVTAVLAMVVIRSVWRWHPALVTLMSVCFLAVDLAFFAADPLKVCDGGWFPLMPGAGVFFLPMIWYKGKKLLHARSLEGGIPFEPFLARSLTHPPHRIENMAVLLTGNAEFVPVPLLYNLKHNRVLHERVVFISFVTHDTPYVDDKYRVSACDLDNDIYIVKADCGFKETPGVYHVLKLGQSQIGTRYELMDISFFIARESVAPFKLPGMSIWHERLFTQVYQNSAKPPDFFYIPINRVVELGIKVEI